MAEPRIQYAKTEDGMSIAYWTLGEGEPLVVLVGALSHVQIEWQIPPQREWYERLACDNTLVRFDRRGSGLSDRDVHDYSLDALLLDLEAVVDRLGLERISLFGIRMSGRLAIAYSARHPNRVSKLLLWCSAARSRTEASSRTNAFRALREADWNTYVEALVEVGAGTPPGEDERRAVTRLYQEAVTPEAYEAYLETSRDVDVTDLLARVDAPTLVLDRPKARDPGPARELVAAKQLAAKIPNAQLALLEGSEIQPFLGDADAVETAINDFLGIAKQPDQDVSAALPEGTMVILFLDIADSTALTTKLGDAAYREKERELDTKLRAAIAEAGGTPVEGKVLGDGVMAVFASARQAIDAAVRCRDLGNEAGLPLHIGIHAGDVVREGNNVHGGAVQVASRVQGVAEPGEILVSATVRDLARTSAGVAFEDRGEHALKGIPEPQRLFAVREQD